MSAEQPTRRSRRRVLALLWSALMLPLLALGTASPPAAASPDGPRPSGASTGPRVVHYDGVSVTVPGGWPVRRYPRGSAGCVRFDRHAVYLGRPARSTCPPHLVGTVASVQILRGAARLAGAHTRNRYGLEVFGGSGIDGGRQVQATSGGARVVVTTGSHRALADGIVASVREIRGVPFARPQTLTGPTPPSSRRTSAKASRTTTGLGFDACAAPSVKTMQAWGASPYRTIGVYVGGAERACSQPNLTASWVSTVAGLGWSVIPTYVGLQAPCTRFGQRIRPARAAAQGARSANDAISELNALGMRSGTPVYFDMEGYPTTNASCVAAVETFLDAWTARLQSSGYRSGVYSSAGSGITALVKEAGKTSFHLPDDIWFAHWNGKTSTMGDSYIPDTLWANHHRVHQYRGGHNETYGGVTINIDNDSVDADTAGGSGTGGVAIHTTTAVNLRPGPSTGSGAALATMPKGTWPAYHCWVQGQVINGVDVWFNVTYGGTTGYYTAAYSSASFSPDSQITTKYGLPQCGTAAAVDPVIGISPAEGRRSTVFSGSGSGFSPDSTVTQRLIQPDGTRFTGTHTRVAPTNASGSFTWSWTWTAGSQFGTYTYVAIDVSGVKARTRFTVDRGSIRNTGLPQISGTPRVGASLTASTGSWSPAGVSVTYQWLRGGLAMSGRTGSTYLVRPADKGATISVRVHATETTYASATATSAPTSPVAPGLMECPDRPRVVGRARVGRTVSATPLACTSPSGVAYRYRWLLDGRAVRAATHRTLTLTRAERGRHLSVRVRAIARGYHRVVRTSATRLVRG